MIYEVQPGNVHEKDNADWILPWVLSTSHGKGLILHLFRDFTHPPHTLTWVPPWCRNPLLYGESKDIENLRLQHHAEFLPFARLLKNSKIKFQINTHTPHYDLTWHKICINDLENILFG